MKISDREFPDIISKLEQDICICILTYYIQSNRVIKVLKKLKEVNLYKIVSYNHNDLPMNPEIYDLADITVTTHQTIKNVNFPWFWHMKNCITLANEIDFKYIFFICGDTLVGRPDRILKLPKLLGANDLLSYAYSPRAIGTFCWFAKMPALLKIHKEMNKNWQMTGTGAAGIKLRRIATGKLDKNSGRRIDTKNLDLKVKQYDEMNPTMFKIKNNKNESSYLTKYLELSHL